jgi:Na+-transporting NADH:ubiquinone oxidoreductase subunit NqrB
MSSSSPAEARPSGFQIPRVDPRYLIAFLITLVLVAAQFRFHAMGSYTRLALALGTCVVTELALSAFVRGRVANLLSAYISGISLTLLTKPQGALLWPFAIGGFLAIASKYVLQYRGNHVWNPTNFAICVLLLAAPDRVSVLSHQWGNDVATLVLIWAFGLVIASRVHVLHITLTYIAAFLALGTIRALALHEPVLAEIAPITGPMYQLFIFFMITDPRTVVKGKAKQVKVALVIALVEAGLRVLLDHDVPLPAVVAAAPALYALWIVGPVAKWLDLRATPRTPVAAG